MNRPCLACVPAVLALLLASCVTTTDGQQPRKDVNTSPWMQPSAVLKAQIADQLERLPWTHGGERVEQIRWLAGVGEAGYEQILPVCADPRPDVAGSALAALGATGDSRLVEPLRNLDWPPEASLDKGLRFERARTYVRLGAWSELRVLVDGLRDEELWTRAWCSHALFETTKQRFGYEPKAPVEQREAAVRRWEQWLESRGVEGILPGQVAAQG